MSKITSLIRDGRGAVTVEFALIGPVLIAMMLGVLQFGLGMQNYNALRSASADVARYAVVNYQTSNKLTDSQLQNYMRSVATRSPYNLIDKRLEVSIANATTQRVTGATEKTITLSYTIPTMLSFVGIDDIPLTYSRPVFLLNS